MLHRGKGNRGRFRMVCAGSSFENSVTAEWLLTQVNAKLVSPVSASVPTLDARIRRRGFLDKHMNGGAQRKSFLSLAAQLS